MPTATPFTALGKGNGFPFCLDKLDVSEYDYWTTLGGYKKTDESDEVTQAQINLSLKNAMKVFWNFYGYTINAESENPYGDDSKTLTLSMEDLSPKERVCASEPWFRSAETEEDYALYTLVYPEPIRMYNGETEDEGNFVGYGVLNFVQGKDYLIDTDLFPTFSFSSVADDISPSDSGAVEYSTSFGGLPLVAVADEVESTFALEVSIDGLTASFTSEDFSDELSFSEITFFSY